MNSIELSSSATEDKTIEYKSSDNELPAMEVSESIEILNDFNEMNLREDLLRGIYAYGFEKPTHIQQYGINPCIIGRDVIAVAENGTGKTTMILISILQKLDISIKDCQALILTPTRDLARCIEKVVLALADFMEVTCHACIGGTNVKEDAKKLEQGCQIVVGTPGRVFDMITRKALNPKNIKSFVLDETEEILSRGFKEQVHDIFITIPNNIQVISLSTTDHRLDEIKNFMRDPIRFLLKKKELIFERIKQFYVMVGPEESKLEIFCDLYQTLAIPHAIVFCNTNLKIDWLASRLHAKDFTVSTYHGDMDLKDREQILREFRSGSFRIFIATDSIINSVDNPLDIPLVINYDLPNNPENYIYRVSRCGRKSTVMINFVTDEDKRNIHDIEQFYNIKINEMPQNTDLI